MTAEICEKIGAFGALGLAPSALWDWRLRRPGFYRGGRRGNCAKDAEFIAP